jgi:hypothetical protein
MCNKVVLGPIPKTQHHPISVEFRDIITLNNTSFRRRFNYKKANWDGFTSDLDRGIGDLKPIPDDNSNYSTLMAQVWMSARKNIPRGCRTEHVPGLTTESGKIYETYKRCFDRDPFNDETIELGEQLMELIGDERRTRWWQLIEATDMTHNSKKLGPQFVNLAMTQQRQQCTTTSPQIMLRTS